MERQDALDFIDTLAHLYFECRDIKALLRHMVPQITWVGTGPSEQCSGLPEARLKLEQEQVEYGGRFQITERRFVAEPLFGGGWLVHGVICAVPCQAEAGLAGMRSRLSAVCAPVDGRPMLFHVHLSHPDYSQLPDRFFVRSADRTDAADLRRRAAETERELLDLMENLPGGVLRCRNDESFTILQLSQGFLDMLGYTREEVLGRFHSRLIELIHPADRPGALSDTRQRLRLASTIELEYRVTRKDGTALWVLDRSRLVRGDGRLYFNTMLMDITQRKQAQEELRLSLERHQIIMDQTNDTIFEWDIVKDILNFSPNWEKKFGYRPISQGISDQIPISRNIHPEDMPAFIKIMEDTRKGEPYSEAVFRIRGAEGRFTWCRIRATTQYGSDRRPVKAVGVITDIDAEKKHEQQLLEQAQTDSLTGLFNRGAARARVHELIAARAGAAVQALMIIDLDDFKSINDQYGHLCGDAVLSDLAACLKRHFTRGEVLSRIGGDEFAVFLPQLTGREAAAAQAAAVLAAISSLTLRGIPGSGLSCSLGIALCPDDGQDYHRLYQCADLALYQAKNLGKARYAFYYRELQGHEGLQDMVRSAVNSAIDSDEPCPVTERLARYAFRMLYDAVSAKTAVPQMLEIVGQAYDVSRVCIFENSDDNSMCSNTFEWCAEGVASEMANLQKIRYPAMGSCLSHFDGAGIFYCKDITSLHPDSYALLAPQGICALLQCAILDDGVIKGFVGFDECRASRYWTQDRIQSLALVARVLSTFLLKLRLKERVKELEELAGSGGSGTPRPTA